MRILVIEDDREMAQFLKREFEGRSHSVSLALDGRTALEIALSSSFDVIVLDLMVSGVDGFEITRRLRTKHVYTPILALTGRNKPTEIAKALDLGADDCLTKPFALVEFFARLRAIVRRGPILHTPLIRVGDLALDPASHQITRGCREILLTPTEFRLLEFLVRRAGRVLSREVIEHSVWGFDAPVDRSTLDSFIHQLRDKIDKHFESKLIHSVRGIGFTVRSEKKRGTCLSVH